MVLGSVGQLVANPLFAAVRQHRTAQARLLRQLGLTEATEAAGERSTGQARSAAGRRMAALRWRGGGG